MLMGTKQVIIVRADLKLRRGKEAAQVAHAAEAWLRKWLKSWLNCTNSAPTDEQMDYLLGNYCKVVVKATSERELLRLEEAAKSHGLTAHLIVDDGLTEIPKGTVTALAIGPHRDEAFVGLTDHMLLY